MNSVVPSGLGLISPPRPSDESLGYSLSPSGLLRLPFHGEAVEPIFAAARQGDMIVASDDDGGIRDRGPDGGRTPGGRRAPPKTKSGCRHAPEPAWVSFTHSPLTTHHSPLTTHHSPFGLHGFMDGYGVNEGRLGEPIRFQALVVASVAEAGQAGHGFKDAPSASRRENCSSMFPR